MRLGQNDRQADGSPTLGKVIVSMAGRSLIGVATDFSFLYTVGRSIIIVRPKMLNTELEQLKMAFRGRQKPNKWVRENLHPVDSLDAEDFVRDIESGHDRAILFQSAIPYFALLTDEARLFLFPDYLGTLIPYPHQILETVCELEAERGQALLASFAPGEREAVMQFIDSISRWESMRPYLDEVLKFSALVKTK
ncbi:MAG: hypothetical protein JWR19_1047 [Pedosphaera sp.]|nr:hypothetical protein [Pedosphaera sp.]